LPIVADHFRFVVGGDTHAASHSFAVIECPSGRLVAESTFPASSAGLARAVTWISRHTPGGVDGVLVAVEGTGSYGAVLADRLEDAGYRVVEAANTIGETLARHWQNRCPRRHHGGTLDHGHRSESAL